MKLRDLVYTRGETPVNYTAPNPLLRVSNKLCKKVLSKLVIATRCKFTVARLMKRLRMRYNPVEVPDHTRRYGTF